MTYDMGCSVSEEFTVCIFKRCSEDGGSMFLQKSIHFRLFFDCGEGNIPIAFLIEVRT